MKNRGQKRYVFGPVPSRRLGRSLGVDLVPYKTCTYDCVYCQIGRTTERTLTRKVYSPTEEVIAQVRQYLEEGDRPDVITLSGSGEPTLHREIGEVIRAVKDMTDVPVAVLTNASLLFIPAVREALMAADIVVPDLDAAGPEVFQAINRPHPELDLKRILDGLASFASDFRGRFLVEVFLVRGVNDGDEEVKRIAGTVAGLIKAEVQLNTVTRPSADAEAESVSSESLQELARLFDPTAEVLADYRHQRQIISRAHTAEEDVLEMVARRPCAIEDIASGLAITVSEALKCVDALLAENKLSSFKQGGKEYYGIPERS